MSKRPSFQFYPSDWRTDPGLRLCSIAARGLWMEMLCIMHEAEPYGTLTVQMRPIAADALARLIGESASSVKKMMRELADNNVYSVTDDGVIYSRRMLRDEGLRERRAAGGAAGGEHGAKGGIHGNKGGRPPKDKNPPSNDTKGGFETPVHENGRVGQKPPPSSSSPSSSPPSGLEEDPSQIRNLSIVAMGGGR